MNIIPKLNLNKHPRLVEDNSLIDAHNIILDDDGMIQTEPGIEGYDVINNFLKEEFDTDYEIVNIVECNEEIIIFVNGSITKNIAKYNDNDELIEVTDTKETLSGCFLCRYNENYNNIVNTYNVIKYNGGKFTNTYTYNKKDLIISFGEYFEDDSKEVPLKVINLGNFEYIDREKYFTEDIVNVKDYLNNNIDCLNTIVPEIKIPKVLTELKDGNANKGWYYIFVRYKISENNYTQWYNTNTSVLIDSYGEEQIIAAYQAKDGGAQNVANIKRNISNNLDTCNITFNCKVYNENEQYEKIQLGFINVRKDKTNAYKTADLNIGSIINYLYDQNSIEIISVQDLTNSYYNYYNVKTLINWNNVLYIANYKEKDLNKNIIDDAKISYFSGVFDEFPHEIKKHQALYARIRNLIDKDNNEFTYDIPLKTDEYGEYFDLKEYYVQSESQTLLHDIIKVSFLNRETTPSKYYDIYPGTDNKVKSRGHLLTPKKANYYYKKAWRWFTGIGLFWSDKKVITTYNESINHSNINIRIYPFEPVNLYTYDIKKQSLVYKEGGKNYSNYTLTGIDSSKLYDGTIPVIGYITRTFDSSGNLINEYDCLSHTEKFEWYDNETGKTVSIDHLPRGIYFSKISKIIKQEPDTVNEGGLTKKDILNTNCIKPGKYKFFIHFIDKYGNCTYGIPLSENNFTIESSALILFGIDKDTIQIQEMDNYFNEILIPRYQKPVIKLKVNAKLKDSNYIGYFISYAKFEDILSFDGFARLSVASDLDNNYLVYIHNDEFNYKDKIKLGHNQFSIGSYFTHKSINDIKFLPADAGNNILHTTNIGVNSNDVSNINDGDYCRFIDNNVYNNKNTELIPCSQIVYNLSGESEVIINPNTAFFSFTNALFIENTFFDSGSMRYAIEGETIKDVTKEKLSEHIYVKSKRAFKTIPSEFIQVNNYPVLKFFPIKGVNGELKVTDKSYVTGTIVDAKNTIDLFKEKNVTYFDNYPKPLVRLLTDNTFITDFPKTIRRSNVIQDESKRISWRFFESDQYKFITENKGDIIKLVSIGTIILVHTQMSLFIFDSRPSTRNNVNGYTQLADIDIWDVKYQELTSAIHGYGGIEKSEHSVQGEFGYIWYDKKSCHIFRYDSGQLVDIGLTIDNTLRKLHEYDLNIVDDKLHTRLLFNFFTNDKHFVISYNYKSNSWVSLHDYKFNRGYSTKEQIYLLDENKQKLYHYSKTNFNNYIDSEGSSISIVCNTDYDIMKFFNILKYKVYAINRQDEFNSLPVEGHIDYYAGNKLRVYSEFCDTGDIDVSNIGNKKTVNALENYDKPYWRMGNFHVSMLRDIKQGNEIGDKMSRLYGNWFVVKFYFNNEKQIEIESIDREYNKDLV